MIFQRGGHELYQSGVGGLLIFGRFRDYVSGAQVCTDLSVGLSSFWCHSPDLVSMYSLVVSRFGLVHNLI